MERVVIYLAESCTDAQAGESRLESDLHEVGNYLLRIIQKVDVLV